MLAVDLLMSISFLFAVSAVGLVMSLLLRNKSRAVALVYFLFAMGIFLPLIPVVWADYTGRFNYAYNLLYLDPFYPLAFQMEIHDRLFAEQMLFSDTHPWRVTTALYAAGGLIALGISFLLWPRLARRVDSHGGASSPLRDQ